MSYVRVSDLGTVVGVDEERRRAILNALAAQVVPTALKDEAVCGPRPQMLLDKSHSWTCCPNRKKWVIHQWQDKDPCGLQAPQCPPDKVMSQFTGECLQLDTTCGVEPTNNGVVESVQHKAWRACRAQGQSAEVRGTEKISPAVIAVGAAVAASLGLALWITLKD